VDSSQTNIPLEYAEILMYILCSNNTNNINNILTFPNLEPLVIPYQANQLVDLQLWDSNFVLIFLYDIDKFLASNTKKYYVFLTKDSCIHKIKTIK